MKYVDVVEGYFLDRSQTLGKATLKSYELWFNEFGEFVNHKPQFSAITTRDVSEFLQYLQNERKLSDATRLRAWAVLSSLWTWAEKALGTPHVLRGKVSKPQAPKSSIEPLTEEEIKALVKAAQFDAVRTGRSGGRYTARRATAKRDMAIILTLVDCGIRASELCALVMADYDKETIMVPDGMASEVHIFEAQVGGHLRISLTYDSPAETGKSSAHTDTYHGCFVELIPGEKVVQTMAFETNDPRMMGEMQVTYALTEVSGGTELQAVHDFVPDGISAEDNELGWRMSLDKLRRLVEAER